MADPDEQSGAAARWEHRRREAQRRSELSAQEQVDDMWGQNTTWPSKANQQAHEDLDATLDGNPDWNRNAMHGFLDKMAEGTGRDDLSITFGSEELDDSGVPVDLNIQSGDMEYTRKSGKPAIATLPDKWGTVGVVESMVERGRQARAQSNRETGDIGLTRHVTDDAELQQGMRQPKSDLERILGQSFRVMMINTSDPDDEEKFPSSIVIQMTDGSTTRLYSGDPVPGRPGVTVGEIGWHQRQDWKERPMWDQKVHGVEFATPGPEGESVVMTTSVRDEQPGGTIFDYEDLLERATEFGLRPHAVPRGAVQHPTPALDGLFRPTRWGNQTITGGAIIEKFEPMMKARKDLFERAEEAGYDLSEEDVSYMGDFLVLGRPAYAFEGNAAGSYDGDNVFAVYPDGKIEEFHDLDDEWRGANDEIPSPGTPE